ncbi:MAG: AAA family ATPase, partial [Prevotella sp.]|nr:AAA family ATPase [Prevotella sp.]
KKLAENDELRETFFRQAVNSSSYQSYSPNDFFTTLRFFFGNDLFDCFGHLGHSIHSGGNAGKKAMINYRKPEGQALYATLSTLMETPNDFKSFREEILSINQTSDNPLNSNIRETTEATLQVYLNSGASITADGVDDFNLVLLLRSFGREEMIPEIRQVYLDFANAVALSDNEISDDERAWLENLKEKIVSKEIPQQPKEEEKDSERNAVQEHEPVFEEQQKSPMRQLNELIGLRQVKSELQSLTRFIEVNQKRKEAGLRVAAISYHCVFAGNPGTGKTTVARILAGIYRQLGILKKGQLIETDRSGLVAEYVGQTAVKTNKMIDRAIGGVLFIDEAYTLAQGGENDYGREAIATLLKRMEDERDRLVVILAGYTNEIEQFINSNPGLRSRFNRYVHFDDYTEEELFQIFILQAQKYDYHLDDEAKGALRSLLHEKVENRQKDFGNARYVRNLFESVIENQAVRLSSNKETDKESLAIITKADIHE